jgi:hypothetical protein
MLTVKHSNLLWGCAFLSFFGSSVWGAPESPPTKRGTLRRLDTVIFLMEDLSPEAGEVGFRERQLKDSFVKGLKDLGLKVLLATPETGEIVGKMASPPPIFSVDLVVHKKNKDGSFFGGVRLSLMEKGDLLRLPEDASHVVTSFHSEGLYAATTAAEMHSGLQDQMRDAWDRFARSYQKANPPKKIGLSPKKSK